MSFYNSATSTITAKIVHVKDKLILDGPIVPSANSRGVVVIQGTTQFQGPVQFAGTTFTTLTKAQADTHIVERTLAPGAWYKITGVDNQTTEDWPYRTPLYDDGNNQGTCVFLQATSSTTFGCDGYGLFYNPKYGSEEEHYGVWSNVNAWDLYNYGGYDSADATDCSISGTVLTVGGTVNGTWGVGMVVSGLDVYSRTYITSLGTGMGGVGTYNVSQWNSTDTVPMRGTRTFFPNEYVVADNGADGWIYGTTDSYRFVSNSGPATWMSCNFLGYIVGNELTVTELNSGFIGVGQTLSGIGLPPGLEIVALGTGLGAEGTYEVSQTLTINPPPMPPLEMYFDGATSITGQTSTATAEVHDIGIQFYAPGSTTIYGGYSWTNLNGNIGGPDSLLYLGDDEWSKNTYSAEHYNEVYDCIRYDYANDKITRRYSPSENNDVSYTYVEYVNEFLDNWGRDPIAVFQWGNPNSVESSYGVYNNNVLSSYVETINFRGRRFADNEFKGNSYFSDVDCEDNSRIYDNLFTNNSGISDCILVDSDIHDNTIHSTSLYYMILVNDCDFHRNTFNDSWIYDIVLSDECSFDDNAMRSSGIYELWLANESGIEDCNFHNFEFSFAPFFDDEYIRHLNASGGYWRGDLYYACEIFNDVTKNVFLNNDSDTRMSWFDGGNTLQVTTLDYCSP